MRTTERAQSRLEDRIRLPYNEIAKISTSASRLRKEGLSGIVLLVGLRRPFSPQAERLPGERGYNEAAKESNRRGRADGHRDRLGDCRRERTEGEGLFVVQP